MTAFPAIRSTTKPLTRLVVIGALACWSAGCQGRATESGPAASSAPSTMELTVDDPVSAELAAESPSMTESRSPLDAVPENVRDELDQYAEATFRIQQVAIMQESAMQRKFGFNANQSAALAEVKKEAEAFGAELQRLRPEDRARRLVEEFIPKSREYADLVEAQLNAAQKRELFREVVRRQRGAFIFLLPGVPEELKLTESQRAKIYQIVEETRRTINFDNLHSPFELAKLLTRSNAARKAAEDLLTPAQTAEFQALKAK